MRKGNSRISVLLSIVTTRILVVGCTKRSGLATANFLAGKGFDVTANDLKPIAALDGVAGALDSRVKAEFGHQNETLLGSCDLIVLSPGVPRSIPLLRAADARDIPVIAEVELAWHFTKGHIIGITGTDGKSTTTAMCAHVLRQIGFDAREGGNIGIPLVSLADTSTGESVTVAELSSFQLETIFDFHCDCAAFLNLAPDHLDRYASMKEYLAAKMNIFTTQNADDYAILNADDAAVCGATSAIAAKALRFSMRDDNADISFSNGHIQIREGTTKKAVLAQDAMTLKGLHNVQNTMAVMLLVLGLAKKTGREIPMDELARACASFAGLAHRLESAGSYKGVNFINDSKATTVNAVMTALASMTQETVCIVGGRGKGEDYSVMAKAFGKSPLIKAVVLIGETSDEFEKHFARANVPSQRASTMDEAVVKAFELCKMGTVLLSPGCASFDMFENYERRGDAFKKYVAGLRGEC